MVERVAELGMGSRFLFTGFLRGGEVERMYAASDLYVMPSVSEPFGIAPLEAMLYDVPVIISRQSGFQRFSTMPSRSISGMWTIWRARSARPSPTMHSRARWSSAAAMSSGP